MVQDWTKPKPPVERKAEPSSRGWTLGHLCWTSPRRRAALWHRRALSVVCSSPTPGITATGTGKNKTTPLPH